MPAQRLLCQILCLTISLHRRHILSSTEFPGIHSQMPMFLELQVRNEGTCHVQSSYCYEPVLTFLNLNSYMNCSSSSDVTKEFTATCYLWSARSTEEGHYEGLDLKAESGRKCC